MYNNINTYCYTCYYDMAILTVSFTLALAMLRFLSYILYYVSGYILFSGPPFLTT